MPIIATPQGKAILGGSRFTPASISGLTIWLNGPSITGLNDGDALSAWTNLAGGSDFSQATAAKKPIYKTTIRNGNAIVRFDGAAVNGDELAASAISTYITASAYTLFSACAPGTFTGVGAFPFQDNGFFADANGYVGIVGKAVSNTMYAYNYDGTYDVSNQPTTAAAWIAYHARHDSGNLITAVNNGSEASTASGNTASLVGAAKVGGGTSGGLWWPGDIGELLVWNRALTSAERTQVWNYLNSKWSLGY